MPRPAASTRKNTSGTIEIDAPRMELTAPPDDTEFEEPESMELARVLQEMHGADAAKVEIYRQLTHGKDLRYIDEMPPANYSVAMLKHPPYSGGKFRVYVRNEDGRIVANKLVEVEAATPQTPPLAPNAPPIQQSPAQDLAPLMAVIANGFTKLGELIVMSAREQEREKPKTTRDILEELKLYQETLGAPAHTAPPSDPMEQMDKMFSVLEKLRGFAVEPGERTPLDSMLEFAKTVAPLIRDATQGQHAPMMEETPPALPNNAAPTPQRSNPQPTLEERAVMQLKQQLFFLCTQAQRDNDPSTYAGLIVDQVPRHILKQYVEAENWLQQLCTVQPAVAQYKEWFEELRGIVVSILTDEQGAAQTPDVNAPTPGSGDVPS